MKNKQIDLNNHLFLQLERLSDEDLKGDELSVEIKRSHAVANVAKGIIENGRLALQARKAVSDGLIDEIPSMLGVDEK